MWIKEIKIRGFKSYENLTELKGLDRNFNSFTGLNGSGKSNVLDAITFALGLLKVSEARASGLHELIFNNAKGKCRQASVVLIFDNSEHDPALGKYANCSTLSVARIVQMTKTAPDKGAKDVPVSKFLINGKAVPREEVVKMFARVQLNIEAATFLIRQGKVTEVIRKKPKELLMLTEESSGTLQFRKQSDEIRRKLNSLESRIGMYTDQLQEMVRPQLAQRQGEHDRLVQAEERLEELKVAERVLPVKSWQELREQLAAAKAEAEPLQQSLREMEAQLAEQKDLQAATRRELEQLRAEDHSELEASVDRAKTELARKQTSVEGAKAELEALESRTREAAAEAERAEQALATAADFSEHERTLRELSAVRENHDSTAALLKSLAGGMGEGYAEQLRTQRNKVGELRSSIREIESKLQSDVSEQEYAAARAALDELREKISAKKIEIESLGAPSDSSESSPSERIHELRAKRAQLDTRYRSNLNLKSELERRDSRLNCDFPGFSRGEVLGLVGQLFSVAEEAQNKTTALEMCAGARLFNVVVANDEIGQRLLNLRLNRRITVLPLNKIQAWVVAANKLASAKQVGGGKVDLALSLVKFSSEVSKAMEFVFGSTLIADKSVAQTVTFHGSVRTRSITPEGDVYEPSGTLTGGFVQRTNFLAMFDEWNQCMAQHKALNTERSQVAAELERLESGASAHNDRARQLKARGLELAAMQDRLSNGADARTVAKFEAHRDAVGALEAELAQCQADLQTAEERMSQLQRDQAEFTRDKEGKMAEYRERLAALKQQVSQLEKSARASSQAYDTARAHRDQLEHKLGVAKRRIQEYTQASSELQSEERALDAEVERLSEELRKHQGALDAKKAALRVVQDQRDQKHETLRHATARITQLALDTQLCSQELDKVTANTEELRVKSNKLLGAYPWLATPERYAGPDYDWTQLQPSRLRELSTVLEQKAQIEAHHSAFDRKLPDILRDLRRNVDTIEGQLTKLRANQKKILKNLQGVESKRQDVIMDTFHKVSSEMGIIFETFLPGSSCWLALKNEADIHEGVEVKVRIGGQIKESVLELSGGQKSLVGLSLTFAMLKVNPAPVYLLDEVDAALDDNHTQSLGKIITQRFKESQFILVSLKDSLYMSGNKVFHVSVQNGRSSISLGGTRNS